MSNKSPQKRNDSELYSVRHPRNVWIVRVFGVLLTLSALQIGDSNIENLIPNRHAKWAANWVIKHGLNLQNFENIEEPEQFFAVKTDPESNNSLIEKTPNQDSYTANSKKPIAKKYTDKSILSNEENSVITLFAFEPSNKSVLIQEETQGIPEIEIDYERNLQVEYARMAMLNNGKTAKKNNKWLASGAIGPQYASGQVLEPNAQTYSEQSEISSLTAYQNGVGSNEISSAYAAMLNVGIDIGNKFEILSGMNYSQLGGTHSSYFDAQVQKEQTILTSVATNNEDGTTSYTREEQTVTYTNHFADTLRADYKLSSIEIPLVLKYNFGKRKLNYFLSSGVSTTIGSSYSAVYSAVEIGEGNINSTKYGVDAVNLLLGVGLQYKATKHLMLNLSPGYRYGIPVSDASYYKNASSSLGLFTGFNYYF